MPEGDTIAMDALRLRGPLLERPVHEALSRRFGQVGALIGHRAVRLDCHGKNLVIHMDDGVAVRVHRRMTGIWVPRAGRPGTLRGVDLALDVGEHWVVARDMPVLEVLRPGGAQRHPALRALGPDLIGLTVLPDGPLPLREPDWDAVRRRVAARRDRRLHELLLDQRCACGIGNVYKSELLFLHGLDPWAVVGDVEPDVLDAVYRDARRLLVENTRPGRRTTRGEGRTGALWVYGRGGRPCLRCRTPILHDKGSGDLPRVTSWCPHCQRSDGP